MPKEPVRDKYIILILGLSETLFKSYHKISEINAKEKYILIIQIILVILKLLMIEEVERLLLHYWEELTNVESFHPDLMLKLLNMKKLLVTSYPQDNSDILSLLLTTVSLITKELEESILVESY
jgi:hypothetical protein